MSLSGSWRPARIDRLLFLSLFPSLAEGVWALGAGELLRNSLACSRRSRRCRISLTARSCLLGSQKRGQGCECRRLQTDSGLGLGTELQSLRRRCLLRVVGSRTAIRVVAVKAGITTPAALRLLLVAANLFERTLAGGLSRMYVSILYMFGRRSGAAQRQKVTDLA